MIKYSVIIPIYNEEDNVLPLLSVLTTVMATLGGGYEILLMDDGSADLTAERFRGLNPFPKEVKMIRLEKKCGKSTAVQAGFDAAAGSVVITLDGDLQNDPADIPKLTAKIDEGYDAVFGWRPERTFTFVGAAASWIGNRVQRLLLKTPVRDTGCFLAAYRRPVIEALDLRSGRHRFMALMVMRLGFHICEVEVRHRDRFTGTSKYKIGGRLVQGIADLFDMLFHRGPMNKANEKEYVIKEIIQYEK